MVLNCGRQSLRRSIRCLIDLTPLFTRRYETGLNEDKGNLVLSATGVMAKPDSFGQRYS